jgi:hypothetical protein
MNVHVISERKFTKFWRERQGERLAGGEALWSARGFAAGVAVARGSSEKLMEWWWVEMERLLGFARGLPIGVAIKVGFGWSRPVSEPHFKS